MNNKLLTITVLLVLFAGKHLSAKGPVKAQTLSDTTKQAITEEWQKNPEAFIKLFFGNDLNKRPPQNKMTQIKKDDVKNMVVGSYVEWEVIFGIWPIWLFYPEDQNRKIGSDNLGLFYPIGKEFAGWMDLEDCYRLKGKEKISWKLFTNGIPPQTNVIVKIKIEWVSASIWKNGWMQLYVRGSDVDLKSKLPKCNWPEYTEEIYASPVLRGIPTTNSFEIMVKSDIPYPVKVGLRSGNKGKDFIVPKNGRAFVRVPRGEYGTYYQNSISPADLYQGDSLHVKYSGFVIQLKKEGLDKFRIHKVE